ncbi:uncharacterized protein [Pyrus communis]|uniref:uncharacterized protein n=1 Tax=Pyrus communis TaxID=23211 RepID=UPI0035BF4931
MEIRDNRFLFGHGRKRADAAHACEQHALFGVQLNLYGHTISHIFFADDTLMFLKADKENCHNLMKLIEIYFEASGQQVNLQKSSVFFGSNVPAGLSEEFGAVLRMPIVDNPGTYLGVPAMWGRSKSKGLAYVKDPIMRKIQGWQHVLLSQAGKEVLIKAMVQAIPVY